MKQSLESRNFATEYGCNYIGYRGTKALSNPEIYIGPEIEVENTRLSTEGKKVPWAHWAFVKDGSLRQDGLEIRASHPLAGQDVIEAIQELESIKGYLLTKPTFSSRTSTHFHLNVSCYTLEQVANAIMNYIVYAEQLFYHIGKIKFDRRGTSYCRPLAYQDNLVEMWNLYKAKKYRGMLAKISRTWPKYNSMYLNFGFGTMELRMFNASIESAVLIKWINITTDFIANAVDLPVKTGSPNPDEYQETLHKLFPNTYAEIAPHASFEDVKHIEEVIPVNPKLTDSTLRAFKKHLVKDEPKATMPPPSVLKPKTYTVATPVSASQLEYQEWLSTANQLNEELTPLNSNIVTDLNQLINTLTSPSDPIFSEEN